MSSLPAHPASPRDAYLAWQAEIGTDEVILPGPWIRPRREEAPAAQPEAPWNAGAAPRGEPGGRVGESPARPARTSAPAAASNFFASIAEALARPEAPSKTRAAAPAAAPPPALSPALFPELPDLEAYWNHLAAEYPKWFPGAGPLVRATGVSRPALAVVELSPSGEGVFAGEAGELLEKMMRAIGLERDRMYWTSVLKTPPPGRRWARRDAARMLPALFRELKLAECGLVLLLGEACAQAVLRTGQGLAALEGTAVHAEDLAFVATWHPSDLLKDESLKPGAWTQLKWLRDRLPARGSGT